MTSCRAISRAPRARQVVTITGSICGVMPTATDTEKSSAESQSPLVRPLSTNTTGHITSMNATSTRETEATPASKLVWAGRSRQAPMTRPTYVSSPVATTTARADPETTLVPVKTMFPQSPTVSTLPFAAAGRGSAVFSTGSLSPVSAAWLRKRSFASMTRASAGTRSPAARRTTSPTTSSEKGTSRSGSPARSTQHVVVTSLRRDSAAARPRSSCTKRSTPEMATITAMMTQVEGSSSPGAARMTLV